MTPDESIMLNAGEYIVGIENIERILDNKSFVPEPMPGYNYKTALDRINEGGVE